MTDSIDNSSHRQFEIILPEYSDDPNSPRNQLIRFGVIAGTSIFCLFYGLVFAFLAPYLLAPLIAPVAVLFLLVVWALPSSRAPPTHVVSVCLMGLLCTLLLWPNYLAIAIPGLPWITLNRLMEAPLAVAFLVSLSQSQHVRTTVWQSLKSTPVTWPCLAGFVVIQFATLGFSHGVASSFQDVLTTQITFTGVYFASTYVFLRPGTANRWAVFMWVIMMVLGVIAIIEFRHGRVPWAGHIPGFLKIEDPIVQAILLGGGRAYSGVYRTQATFSTALGFGEFIALAVPFVFHFAINGEKPIIRIAAALSIPFVVYIATLSGSRSAMIGSLTAGMLSLASWAFLRWRRRKNDLIAPAVILGYPALALVLFAATFFVGRLKRAVWGGAETVPSTQARIDQWHLGIPIILKNPLGHGAAQSGIVLGYRMANGTYSVDSYVLSVLLEYGVPGLILLYTFFLSGIYYAVAELVKRTRHDGEYSLFTPLLISIVNFVVVKSVFSERDNHPLVYMMLGMITALVCRSRQEAAAQTSPSSAGRKAV